MPSTRASQILVLCVCAMWERHELFSFLMFGGGGVGAAFFLYLGPVLRWWGGWVTGGRAS